MFSPFSMGFSFTPLIMVLILWSLFWKAWALWISARRGEKIWFGAILVFNTVGILEILYIYIFSKDKAPKVLKDVVVDAPEIKEENKTNTPNN